MCTSISIKFLNNIERPQLVWQISHIVAETFSEMSHKEEKYAKN